jgi:hypothetical protein
MNGAEFSSDGKLRFALFRDCERVVPGGHGMLHFIGLNPSTADGVRDDPTARKYQGFAKRWGYSSLVATNLNPTVTSDPRDLARWEGGLPENLEVIKRYLTEAETTVCAWGCPAQAISRRIAFTKLVKQVIDLSVELCIVLWCIGETRDASPIHASRTAYTERPVLWRYGNSSEAPADRWLNGTAKRARRHDTAGE